MKLLLVVLFICSILHFADADDDEYDVYEIGNLTENERMIYEMHCYPTMNLCLFSLIC